MTEKLTVAGTFPPPLRATPNLESDEFLQALQADLNVLSAQAQTPPVYLGTVMQDAHFYGVVSEPNTSAMQQATVVFNVADQSGYTIADLQQMRDPWWGEPRRERALREAWDEFHGARSDEQCRDAVMKLSEMIFGDPQPDTTLSAYLYGDVS